MGPHSKRYGLWTVHVVCYASMYVCVCMECHNHRTRWTCDGGSRGTWVWHAARLRTFRPLLLSSSSRGERRVYIAAVATRCCGARGGEPPARVFPDASTDNRCLSKRVRANPFPAVQYSSVYSNRIIRKRS